MMMCFLSGDVLLHSETNLLWLTPAIVTLDSVAKWAIN